MTKEQKLSGMCAIAADIHGNIKRLLKFKSDVKSIRPKQVFLLGDLIEGTFAGLKEARDDNTSINIIKEAI
mgnify:FL=1